MIYDSLDIIPAKLFFRIEQTEEYKLLSTESTYKDLSIVWDSLKEQHDLINPNREENKVLKLSKRIEALSAKYEATKLAVIHLKIKRDQELIDLLKDYGFTLHLNKFQKHLDMIERENKSLIIQINNLKHKLPKDKERSERTSFDEVILSYGVLTNSGFIDTNTITITQYYALINLGNRKLKELETNGKRK